MKLMMMMMMMRRINAVDLVWKMKSTVMIDGIVLNKHFHWEARIKEGLSIASTDEDTASHHLRYIQCS